MKKKFLALVLTLAMVLSLVPVTALAADTGQSNIQNPASVTSEDKYVELEKTAAAVEGSDSDNTFEITLKATVKDGKQEGAKTSTDAVLVIDRSGSMMSEKNGDRITPAQDAAKAFASVVLGEGANKQNQIAVVSYAESATTDTGLSSDLETVKNAINFSAYGGTNIQAGIKAARDILQSSRADNKVILVLSDGEPTYSFRAVGTATQTGCKLYGKIHSTLYAKIDPTSVNITEFDYNSIAGSGSDYRYDYTMEFWKNSAKLQVTCEHNKTESERYPFYDNNGQPTIQEASYAKEDGCEIYSIYLGKPTDTNAVSTMTEIATDNDHYKLATDASELGELFKGIAKDITLSVTPGTVTDPMGDHMNLVASSLEDEDGVAIAENGKQFTWDLTKVTPTNNQDGSRTYVLTYQIIFDTDFDGFDATKFYPTNKETTLAYTVQGEQKKANFPIPEVKGKAVTYQLTYDANGGNEGSVPTDNNPYTKNAIAPLNYDTKPTHTQENVIFIGWSETKDTKIYNKGDKSPALIQSVTINGNKIVYAVWGYDAIGGEGNTPDGVPDVFNAVVTYNIVGGTWDGTNNSATEVIKVKTFDETTKVWTNTDAKLSSIPNINEVRPDENHTLSGSWGDPDSTPTENTVVTADKMYTYTLSEVTTGTLTITKKVVGLTLDKLPDEFTIKVTAGNETKELKKTNTTSQDQDNGTLTWTIPKLDSGTYTVSEENAGVDGYTYKDTYTSSKNTDTGKSVTVEVNDTITMTVTNTYTKNATVNLSDLIKKELTVKKNSTLPTGTTFTVKVTPTPTGDQGTQPAIIGTTTSQWTGGIEAEGNTTYTVPFNFEDKDTLSLPTGTHTYTVQETEGDVSGVEYDSTTYQLTITAKMDGSYSASYTVAPTGDAAGTTSTEVSTTKPLTIKNTYQTPDLSVTKQTVSVDGKPFDSNTVAHVNNQIIWSVTVKNKNSTPAQVTLTDAMAEGVYTDNKCEIPANWNANTHSWTATVSDEVTYYVTYTVKADDISKGKIVNTILMKNGGEEKTANSDPVSTWDTKQLKSATSLSTSDWTTTVTLTLPTVNKATDNNTVNPVVISKGSYVIDKIGNEFTFVPELKLTLKVGDTDTTYTGEKVENTDTYNFGTKVGEEYPYTVTYTAKNDETQTPAQFKWEIKQDIPAGTKVTLSYKLKLTNPNTAAGTYGVTDLDGNGFVDGAETTKVVAANALYTNESATLYKDKQEIAVFPKPSVSYTIKGSSGGHGGNGGGTVTIPDDVPTGLNGKDHYAYVVGYPDGMVYPQKNITRAEVATIFFRLLKDETREANMTKSNSYNDMKDGAWYTCAVSTLSKMGIIKGYEDGSFKPDASISRAEFAAIAARFDPDGDKTPATFSDVSSHWAKDEISIAANHGWIKGYEDGSFKPDQKITRAETMTLVNRVLKRLPETKDDLHKDMKTWPDNQKESAWFYLAVQEATNSHYQKLKKDGTHETWESMRETRDWAALEK